MVVCDCFIISTEANLWPITITDITPGPKERIYLPHALECFQLYKMLHIQIQTIK